MMPPFLSKLARDRSAPPRTLSLTIALLDQRLLTVDWQRLKILTAGHAMGFTPEYAGRLMQWLVAHHYLERRDEPFVGALYRIKGDA